VGKSDVNIFVDSDFVFVRDIYALLDELNDLSSKLLWVVKHDYKSPEVIKMDNQSQFNYNKKLWSSFMVFHPNNLGPTVEEVNEKPGNWLHGFNWLREEDIGSLHEGWNFIPDYSGVRVPHDEVRAIHYTEGTPLMCPGCQYAEVFNYHLKELLEEAKFDPLVLA
jgi:hypothetical protein